MAYQGPLLNTQAVPRDNNPESLTDRLIQIESLLDAQLALSARIEEKFTGSGASVTQPPTPPAHAPIVMDLINTIHSKAVHALELITAFDQEV